MKLSMDLREILLWIKHGIENGRYEAALGIVNDVLAQLPPEKVEEPTICC